ncbi:unnamed protein product, partial [Polarella glacialis]
DLGDGWVRVSLKVGERFMPLKVQGCAVLLPRHASRFRSDTRLEALDQWSDEEAENAKEAEQEGGPAVGPRSPAKPETAEEQQRRLQAAEKHGKEDE